MSASSLFFLGRVIRRPGVYSKTDVSGLEGVALGATGIVAVLGEAEGGRPVSAITEVKDLLRFSKPEKMRKTFRSGDLREVGGMLFEPGKDIDVPSGAVEVVAMKVNPATQSLASFANAQGDALDVTSVDYGGFTGQINVSIADGTTQGKLLTITFEDTVESVDDLGGDAMFKLKYVAHADGWDTMTGQVQAGGNLVADATRVEAGLDGDLGTQLAADGAVEIVSSDAGDIGIAVEIWGIDGAGLAVKETITTDAADGTTVVVGSQVFDRVVAIRAASDPDGTITVQALGAGAAVMTTIDDAVKGGKAGVGMFVSGGKVSLIADDASVKDVVIEGMSPAGAVQRETVTLTGTVAVLTAGDYSSVTVIGLADVAAATGVTLSAEAAKSFGAVQTTVLKAADFFNAKQVDVGASTYGFTLTLVTGSTGFGMVSIDAMPAAVSVLSPANPSFLADLWAIASWITQNSQLISAAAATGASGGAPSNTVSPVFLTGGGEGTTVANNWQAALNLLKQIRVNTVVPLTGDPAVHAMCDAHCAYMGGIGRSERDCVVGIQHDEETAGAGTGPWTDVPNKDEYKSQVVDLNTRHIRAVGQAIERFNTAAERAEFTPPFHAAVIAGMQAGSAIATSLTNKYANVLSLRQHSTWNPTDDAEEMIAAGCCFMESVDGVGRRVVRNVTTYLVSANVALTEASVNEAANYISYEFRSAMEVVVGKKGFAGTINAGKVAAINKLGLLIDEETMVAYQALSLDLIVDTLEVACQIAPAIPINFVPINIHLITINQSAA